MRLCLSWVIHTKFTANSFPCKEPLSRLATPARDWLPLDFGGFGIVGAGKAVDGAVLITCLECWSAIALDT